MKFTFRSFIVVVIFFATMITSLRPDNIYVLCIFSVSTLFLLPFRKWWDGICLSLFAFSLFYCFTQYMNETIGSGFVFIATLLAPIAFYRFGRWVMEWLVYDNYRMWFLFAMALCYLSPMLLLTITDIQLGGFINESRELLGDILEDNLAATLYGLKSSVGIGFVAALFAKQLKISSKLLLVSISIIAMITVLHLVNRTGIVEFGVCVLFSFLYSTKFQPSKAIYAILVLLVIVVVIRYSGILGEDVVDAYMKREDGTEDLGGRSELWVQNFQNLLVEPFGWHRHKYAHNLWLDLAAVGGWLALVPFLIATFKAIGCFIKVFRQQATPLNLIILTSFVSMFLGAMVEPVIEGSLLFFVLFIMNWGMLKSISR